MKQQLLLLQDVPNLGRKGDLVSAKPGFVRNFLIPQAKAVIASKGTLRMRTRLQEERAKQAAEDKVEAEKLSKVIEGKKLSVEVKIDPAGHLYGSVAAVDIVKILADNGVDIDKKQVVLPKPIKKLGEYVIDLSLNEGVPAKFTLEVLGEGGVKEVKKPAPVQEEEAKVEEAEEEKSEE